MLEFGKKESRENLENPFYVDFTTNDHSEACLWTVRAD